MSTGHPDAACRAALPPHQPTPCPADRPVLKEERRDSGLKEERTHSGLKEERTKEERTHSIPREERAKEERAHSIPKEEHRHSGEHHGHHAKEGLAAEGQRQLAGTPTRLLDREGSAKFAAPRQGCARCLARQAPGQGRSAHCVQLWCRAWGAHSPLYLADKAAFSVQGPCPSCGTVLWGAHWPPSRSLPFASQG